MANSTSLVRPRWRRKLTALAGIDSRSLATFRIALGSLVLFDLAARAFDLTAHYSDLGVLSRAAAAEIAPLRATLYPLYFLNGSTAWSAFLFLATAAAAFSLLVGYRSRWSALVCWYLVFCLQVRNPLVVHGGDNLLRALLFWAMFLPIGILWSRDQRRSRNPSPKQVVSAATVAALLQVCLVYWFTVVKKSGAAWRVDRTAVIQALHLDHLISGWGEFLQGFPDLLAFATSLVFALEVIGPLLIWSPILTGPLRFFVALAFIQFHLVGLAPALDLGTFPWVSATSWLLVVPSWFWDQITESAEGSTPGQSARSSLGSGKPQALRPLGSALVVGLIALIIWGNVRSLASPTEKEAGARAADRTLLALGLRQNWSMFAPAPATDDGWPVLPARAGGEDLDLWTEEPLRFQKPARVRDVLRNSRWNKYIINLASVEFATSRPEFTRYVCRNWNRAHPERAVSQVDFVFMLETYSPTEGEADPVPLPLGRQNCEPPKPKKTR